MLSEIACSSYNVLNTIALIIPAAGSGSRLNQEIPKPYIDIGGRPVLEYTIRPFLEIEGLHRIIVATSRAYMKTAQNLLDSIDNPTIAMDVVEGGKERQHSIYNALSLVDGSDFVIVHDAVRPFVTFGQIQKCCEVAEEVGGAVLGVPAKDTIKKVDEECNIRETPSRQYLWQAQTPQVFRTDILKQAYEEALKTDFIGTDDASLVEEVGFQVRMVEGDRANFKITYPLDLRLAKLLLEKEENHES